MRSLTSILDRASRLVSDVRSGEALTALLFASSLFVGLFAYYVLKTVREPLILVTGGAEVKTYATAIQALFLMGLIPLYGAVADRVSRRALILGAQLVFLASLEGFAWLSAGQVPYLGVVFYVWLGVYVLTSITQLWSLANDVYGTEEGMRLFPLVAIGGPLGAAAGALFAARVFEGASAISTLIHLSAGLLLLQSVLLWLVLARPEATRPTPKLEGRGGFALVLGDPYLRWVALLVVLLNFVNGTGEFLLSRAMLDEAASAFTAAGASGAAIGEASFRETFLRSAYGDFYFAVNVASVLAQALVVSRLVRLMGIRGALFALPIVALLTYGLAAIGVSFVVFRALKLTENATDYSAQNTGKALLWLPTSRDAKYKAKQVVDAYFMRVGDVLAAGLVFVAAMISAVSPRLVALANALLSALALLAAWKVAKGYEARSAGTSSEAPR